VLKDIGLGIGLDYGQIHMVQIGGEFTVVGTPVVYACRMAGAYEQLLEEYSAFCDFDSCEIDIKHEGKTLTYRVRLNGKVHQIAVPEWDVPLLQPSS
jgi:adenylate cyclase